MATLVAKLLPKQVGGIMKGMVSRSIIYSQIRTKTYLVGVDGSDYGYSALKTASTISTTQDKLISIYFPPNIAVKSD